MKKANRKESKTTCVTSSIILDKTLHKNSPFDQSNLIVKPQGLKFDYVLIQSSFELKSAMKTAVLMDLIYFLLTQFAVSTNRRCHTMVSSVIHVVSCDSK